VLGGLSEEEVVAMEERLDATPHSGAHTGDVGSRPR
jgi:hypothetical protein